ncbi:PHP domain-containing protein [Alginatibacterium sediminis]|uniref:PHP domain-containing protein n=1 Tax=Alginatibacterium sediminis TaxID=2164068 RepID=A0A420EI66_9ALTE|nr:PHP domain-containing protein [Alginatibacterium sediminis]RKF20399.1 PHP domain-containing protein [Alginatibacterium sediminis]
MRIDLHSHTKASDGALTPQELIIRAHNMQLDIFAITDHDTTAGLGLAHAQNSGHAMRLINGVEISCAWHAFDIHVVGLNVDIEQAEFQAQLSEQREKRDIRAQEMGKRLAKAGIEGIYEAAKARAGEGSLTRAHFAQELVHRGHADNFQKVFDKFLSRGNTGYVPNQWMTIPEAITCIQAAGGVAVLAHPNHYQLSNKWLRKLVAEFASAGGNAVEIGLPQFPRDKQHWMADLVNEHGLYASLGSDFHQVSRWRELGRGYALPEQSKSVMELLAN